MLCTFVPLTTDGPRRRYRCTECGRVTGWTRSPPDRMRAKCGNDHPAWLACEQRGGAVQTETTGRGCGKCTVALHRCGEFGELVTLRPAPDLRRARTVDGYTGRSCARCVALPASTLPAAASIG